MSNVAYVVDELVPSCFLIEYYMISGIVFTWQ